MASTAVLVMVIICVWTVSAASGSNINNNEVSASETHHLTSPQVSFTDTTVHTPTGSLSILNSIGTSILATYEHYNSTLSTSGTSTSSILETQNTTRKTIISTASTPVTQKDMPTSFINATKLSSVDPSMLSTNQIVSTMPLSQTSESPAYSTTLLASPTYQAMVLTDSQTNTWIFPTYEAQSWSSLLDSHSTKVTILTALSTSWSTQSFGTASQSFSPQQVQPTSGISVQSTSIPKSESVITSSPTRTMLATSTPEAPPQKPSQPSDTSDKSKVNSAADMASGTKIAIGVIVTLCLLGVVIAGIVVYRKYNFTHRSLKSFLTSGVRYKTYNNATYKDDEGMLIMPDER